MTISLIAVRERRFDRAEEYGLPLARELRGKGKGYCFRCGVG